MRNWRVTAASLSAVVLLPVAAAAGGPNAGTPPLPGAAASALPAAPDWSAGTQATPRARWGAPCPRATNDPNTASAGQQASATGSVPWPVPPAGTDAEHYAAYLHTAPSTPPVRPANWANGGGNWKLTSARASDPTTDENPQELCAVEGNSVDTAWQVSTGRPSTVIAVTDSGIEWCDPGVVDKVYVNRQAVPPPQDAQGRTAAVLGYPGHDGDAYDLTGSGVLNAAQYTHDPRVLAVAKDYGGLFCHVKRGGYGPLPGVVSSEDLIRTFGTPTLPDGSANPYYYGRQAPAGFTEAISGWNFVDDTNDPYDSVHYDHGTGEAQDSTGAANAASQEVGTCPSCLVLPVRVGVSFIAPANAFAEGVLFAIDSGARVIQEALGSYDVTGLAQQAINYAVDHGVPVIASAADEESEHHNLPAALQHTIVVNSITAPDAGGTPEYEPNSYLYLNGCTNFGANIAVSVESASCSSEATGKSGGVAGLIESEADNLLAAGKLAPYPGLRTVSGQPVALSANEVKQLITMAADDVDFASASPPYPPDDYAMASPPGSTRYPTTAGFDSYTGYGRLDAARILSWLAAGRIPPQAQIDSPSWFSLQPTTGPLTVRGVVGTTRASSYRYQVDVAAGPAPAPSAWRAVYVSGRLHGVKSGVLATIPLAQAVALLPHGTTGGPVTAAGTPSPDRFTLSIRVVVKDSAGLVGEARRAVYPHRDPTLLHGYPRNLGASIDAPPTLAPIGPGGSSVLIVATSDGVIRALEPDGGELPGWPVHTRPWNYHAAEPAFASGAVSAVPYGSIIGGVAVGDLRGNGHLDVIATDLSGHVYAWDTAGRLLPHFPVSTNPAFSGRPAAVDARNRVLPGILAAPALAALQGGRKLDIVAAAMDRHVYAWQPDGKPVPGWPVEVVDPSQVASVDPTTGAVTFTVASTVTQGTKLMDTPAIGALSGHGRPDVVVGSNEEYLGSGNVSAADALNTALSAVPVLNSSNSRIYALDPRGTDTPARPGHAAPPGDPGANAILPGWPASIADFDAGLLPVVGDGTNASPALADLAGNGALQVAINSTVGPEYVLNPDGSSYFGNGPDGKPLVLSSQPTGAASTTPGGTPSIPSLGMPVFAPLGSSAPGVSVVAPATSAERALDAALPADQRPHPSQIDAWSTATRHFDVGFPATMNDLEFLDQPIVANVGGPGAGPYIVEGSSLYDLRALDANGQEAPGFPKFTGGWMVQSASAGPFGALPSQVVTAGTREGYLFVWSTPTPACASAGPWPREHHDLENTSNLAETAAPKPRCVSGG